jgi:hypothetical protein
MLSHHAVARDSTEDGLTRLIGVLAVVLPLTAVAQVLANGSDYHQPAAAVAVWLAVIAAGPWLVPKLRSGGLTPVQTVAAIAIAIAAVGAIGVLHRGYDAKASADLAILGTLWLLVLVVMSHSARVWVPASLLVFAVHAVLLLHDAGLNRVGMSKLAAATYIIAAMLSAFAALRSAFDQRADLAARQASRVSRSAAEQAVAAAIHAERRARLAALETEALPLLRAIADGTLDPDDPEVRARCAGHAAALRRSLVGNEAGTGSVSVAGVGGSGSVGGSASVGVVADPVAVPEGELVAGLNAALRAAADRGLAVTVQAIDPQGPAPPSIARAVVATVDALLSALPPHQVLLTLLAAGPDTELYLTFGRPPGTPPELARFGHGLPAAARWQARLSATDDGGGCLELSWRQPATRRMSAA